MELSSAPGFVAFDLDCPTSTDATRTEAARVLRVDGAEKDSAIKRHCAEIAPLVASQEFPTSSDLGTATAGFLVVTQLRLQLRDAPTSTAP